MQIIGIGSKKIDKCRGNQRVTGRAWRGGIAWRRGIGRRRGRRSWRIAWIGRQSYGL